MNTNSTVYLEVIKGEFALCKMMGRTKHILMLPREEVALLYDEVRKALDIIEAEDALLNTKIDTNHQGEFNGD